MLVQPLLGQGHLLFRQNSFQMTMSCAFSALGAPERHVFARAAPGNSKSHRFSLRQRAKSEQEQIRLQSHGVGKWSREPGYVLRAAGYPNQSKYNGLAVGESVLAQKVIFLRLGVREENAQKLAW